MNCAKCGKPLAADAKFCGNCGTVVGAVSKPSWSTFTPPDFTPPPPPDGHREAHGGPTFGEAPRPGAVPPIGGRVPGLVSRVTNILLRPRTEWQVIAGEPTGARDVYFGYVAPLAALGIVAAYVGSTFVGVADGAFTVRAGVAASLVTAAVSFALTFVGVWVLSRILDRLAAVFGGRRDSRNALRVTAYSLTPAWIAAILTMVPALDGLAMLGALYGVYLLYLGLPVLMRMTPTSAIPCAAIVAVCAFVLNTVFVSIEGFVTGLLGVGTSTLVRGTASDARVAGATGAYVGKAIAGSTAEDRARAKDAVNALPGIAAGAVLGKQFPGADGRERSALDEAVATVALLAAGGKAAEPLDANAFLALLPPTLAGMPRTEVSGGVETLYGALRYTVARARYESGASSITLEVGDMGEVAGIARILAWFDPALEKTSEWGYERKYKQGGNFMRDSYDRRDGSGVAGTTIGDRFAISARGRGVAPGVLLASVRAVDAVKLAEMARRQ